jgi:predicted esterase
MLTSHPIELRTIAARVHGRFLVTPGPAERLLVGFHGYAESAEIHHAELMKIEGASQWTVVAVQALHPFYAGRSGQVVASWMTSQERELAIADNIAYVRSVVEQFPGARRLVFAGFSQGAAMAFRAAANIRCDGVIVHGGDVPPDVTSGLPPILLGRGTRDEWYSAEKFEKDLRFLESITSATPCVFDGAHEWSDAFRAAASEFLARLAAL